MLSKSGGLHCYIFMEEFVPTSDLIEALKSFLLPLGLKPTTEIFPKQKELKEDDKGNIKPGNFINLPYYNNGQTHRYAVDKNNSKLSLDQFIKLANELKTTRDNAAAVQLQSLREHRNMLIAQTDWWALGDITMTDAQKTYRQSLRDITKTYKTLDSAQGNWPVKPE